MSTPPLSTTRRVPPALPEIPLSLSVDLWRCVQAQTDSLAYGSNGGHGRAAFEWPLKLWGRRMQASPWQRPTKVAARRLPRSDPVDGSVPVDAVGTIDYSCKTARYDNYYDAPKLCYYCMRDTPSRQYTAFPIN